VSRAQHLAWCKERALHYLDRGDYSQAIASMGSDLTKHKETAALAYHFGVTAMTHAIGGDIAAVRRAIEEVQ
jgi:hypothetical protein